METEEYDALVLGSGGGGKCLSWELGKQGHKVAVVERMYIGGSCPNIACLPSKNIIHSAKVASLFYRSEEFGITKDNCKINMKVVQDRKKKMVHQLVDLHLDLFKKSGVHLIIGNGKFIGPKKIQVTTPEGKTRTLQGKKVFLCLGSTSKIDDIPGMKEARPLTHIGALDLDYIPEHLVILGGGYVGAELAQAMRRFGSKVTIIDHNDRLVHHEDKDISEALEQTFKEEGIEVITNARLASIAGVSGQSVILHLVKDKKDHIVEGTDLLVATGRIPNTKNIGLELTGVELTQSGHVKINEKLETTAPDIWAMGDCTGNPHFTHISVDDFRIVFENLNGGKRVKNGRQVPYCMFTDPEIARIGLNETEAKAKGIPYKLAKMPMGMVLRTQTLSETKGFMKALIDPKTDQIIGFSAFGYGAGEILAAVQVAMLAKLPYTTLRDAVFIHPTLTEGLNFLFAEVQPVEK